MRRWSLSTIVFSVSAAVAAAIVGAFGVYAALRAAKASDDANWAKLESAARASQLLLGKSWNDGPPADLAALCRELSQQLDVRLTVVLPSGDVVADSAEDPRLLDNHRERPEISQALAGSTGRIVRSSVARREVCMYFAVPVRRESQLVAVVRASLPASPAEAALRSVYLEIAACCLLAAALFTGGMLLAARPLVRSLRELRAGTELFAGGEWKFRLPDSRAAEIGLLTESLNAMASQLDDRIQRVLRQQSEHQAMLSSMEEGVMAVDRAGTVLSVNEPCAALLDIQPERLRGRSVYEVLRKPDLLKFIEDAQASPRSLDGDLRFFSPEERWLHAHGTALHDATGQRIGVLIVLHDITRLRRLENVRRDFVANVSHELKTPITSIKGFVETLLDDGFDDHAQAERFLGIALRQVNRLEAIIDDLLSLSRIERGNEDQRIETDPEPLAHVVQVAQETCEKKAADKAIELLVECPADLVAQINGPLLEQAVINLIDNAIKYSDKGATVRVTVARDENCAVIRVIDNGCGIAANHLPRLFERFYRVDKARSRELGGTGLGLAIVKHIMAAHQGTIQVESAVGRGSTFTLRLPLEVGTRAEVVGEPA